MLEEDEVFSVYGVENPLMDIIAHVDFSVLKVLDKKPGTMNLVDFAEIERLLAGVSDYHTMPGGSCANTIRGIAWLNRASVIPAPVFNGSVGRDDTGDAYVRSIEEFGVRAAITRKEPATGVSLILVTPDGERTMNTFLGACRAFGTVDLDKDKLAVSKLLHLTGYLWDTENQKKAAEAAVVLAEKKGIPISFDLADPFAVQKYGAAYLPFIRESVDILFANREELRLLTATACDEDCIDEAARLCPTVVMKVGAKGCYVSHGGEIEHVAGVPTERVRDTTGAGDAFAAGYLFGVLTGKGPAACAALANGLASKIVGVEGCDYQALGTNDIR
jgi:sugar/nucleoside kinase (ribokinase family)